MHIIQLLPELNQGGVERHVADLSSALVAQGHQSTVISAGGALADDIEQNGGRHITANVASKNPITVPARVSNLRKILRQLINESNASPHSPPIQSTIDNHQSAIILHAHSRVPAWLCHFANQTLRIPFVTTVHGFNHVGPYSRIMTTGDAVICVSSAVKAYIQQHYNTPDSKISIIPCGIDPRHFSPDRIDAQWTEQFKTDRNLHGKQIVTTAGRISRTKDLETFIRAIAVCTKTNPDLCGLIVGTATPSHRHYQHQLDALVESLNLRDHICFAGSQTRLPEIDSLSHVVVSPSSKPETFGLTLIEALAMNTPVIASRHGGPLDIIQDGINGHFFTPEDPADLAQKIQASLSYPPTNLRASTIRRFSTEQMTAQHLSIYQTLLSIT